MPDEDTFETVEERVERFEAVERDTLYALTDPDGQPLWSIADLNREMDRTDVIDYVNGLHRAGLVNKTSDGYVFATRPAFRLVQIVGQVL